MTAAGQLVGVCGKEFRVYFYQTYVNQLNKNKGNKVNLSQTSSNGNVAEKNASTNNNQNGNTDKRKRNSPPKSIKLKKDSPSRNGDEVGSDGQTDVKKIKSE